MVEKSEAGTCEIFARESPLRILYNTIVCMGGMEAPRALWPEIEKLRKLGLVIVGEARDDWKRVEVEWLDQ